MKIESAISFDSPWEWQCLWKINKTPYSWGSTVLKCFCFSNSETGWRNKKTCLDTSSDPSQRKIQFPPLFLVCSVTLTLWWGQKDFVICKSPSRLSASVSFGKVFATSQVAGKCDCLSIYLFTNTPFATFSINARISYQKKKQKNIHISYKKWTIRFQYKEKH